VARSSAPGPAGNPDSVRLASAPRAFKSAVQLKEGSPALSWSLVRYFAGIHTEHVDIMANKPDHKISKCRFCGDILAQLLDLGMSPLCESCLTSDQLSAMEPLYPLAVQIAATASSSSCTNTSCPSASRAFAWTAGAAAAAVPRCARRRYRVGCGGTILRL
jgi:Putative zinc binding domain